MPGSATDIRGGSSTEYLGNAFRECIIVADFKPALLDERVCCRFTRN